MAKSFHELSSKAQLAVFIMLCLFTLGGGWQVLIGPQRADLAARQAKLTTLETELTRARSVAARLPQAQREVKVLAAALDATQAVIPDEKDPQDVLRNLHELASDSLLDIATFKPKPVATKAQYTEWPIELGIEGSYHDLGRFFDRIASMPRLMSVADLDIKTKTKTTGRGTIAVSCVATTFVFKKDTLSTTGGEP